MVNEFVATKFAEAVVKQLASFQGQLKKKLATNGAVPRSRRAGESEDDDNQAVAEGIKRGACSVVAREGNATLLEVSNW